jgi:hypothetical protein
MSCQTGTTTEVGGARYHNGLFCILQALHLHLVDIQHLIVKMDAQFIHGMLNNPNVQPNMTINQWIATILLFNFKLIHIPADKHKGPNSLLRCKPADGKEDKVLRYPAHTSMITLVFFSSFPEGCPRSSCLHLHHKGLVIVHEYGTLLPCLDSRHLGLSDTT